MLYNGTFPFVSFGCSATSQRSCHFVHSAINETRLHNMFRLACLPLPRLCSYGRILSPPMSRSTSLSFFHYLFCNIKSLLDYLSWQCWSFCTNNFEEAAFLIPQSLPAYSTIRRVVCSWYIYAIRDSHQFASSWWNNPLSNDLHWLYDASFSVSSRWITQGMWVVLLLSVVAHPWPLEEEDKACNHKPNYKIFGSGM